MRLIDLRSLILIMAIAGGFFGCRAKKDLAGIPAQKMPKETRELYSALVGNQPEFTWFNARGRLKAETEDAQLGASVNLRMLRDSLIWLSIDKFGFELGRALISPDSIWMLDRLNREYYAMDFQHTLDKYGAPFSFRDLQLLIAGGSANIIPSRMSSIIESDIRSLIVENGHLRAQYWFDDRLEVTREVLEDKIGRRVEVQNHDFRPVANTILPFEKYLSMFGTEENAMLRLQFAEIELNVPKSFSFSIPNSYDRVD